MKATAEIIDGPRSRDSHAIDRSPCGSHVIVVERRPSLIENEGATLTCDPLPTDRWRSRRPLTFRRTLLDRDRMNHNPTPTGRTALYTRWPRQRSCHNRARSLSASSPRQKRGCPCHTVYQRIQPMPRVSINVDSLKEGPCSIIQISSTYAVQTGGRSPDRQRAEGDTGRPLPIWGSIPVRLYTCWHAS